jgi:hypothetical protein
MSYPKEIATKGYPVQAKNTSGLLSRVEPLITPAKLRSRFLKGILEKFPSLSFSNDELKDRINLAINDIELELKSPVFAEQFSERVPFDYNLYKHYIHIRTSHGPILSVEDFSIISSDGNNLFRIPPEWIDMGQAHQRQLNVIPLLGAYGSTSVQGAVAPGGIAYLLIIQRQANFVPSYWTIEFTAGLCKDAGQVPVVINNLIGIYAALDILSGIAPNNVNTSVSLGQDGISQSSSNPGPMIFQTRMAELEKRKLALLGQLRRVFGQKYFITNI